MIPLVRCQNRRSECFVRGDRCASGNCESVTFELMDSKVKIWNTGDKIKIKRTASREEAAEA